jgi:hypothetical protein
VALLSGILPVVGMGKYPGYGVRARTMGAHSPGTACAKAFKGRWQ